MVDHDLISAAKELLRGNETYIADARKGVPVGNSVVGGLLSIQWRAPRQQTELAVRMALESLDHEARLSATGTEYVLSRTGRSPLKFRGQLLAEARGKWHAGQERTRWHDLAVYRTEGGRYVVAFGYRTCWQGELDHDDADFAAEAVEVAAVLQEYQPTEYVQGFPDGDAYRNKQARLLDDIRQRYADRVSAILAAAPEFAEEVE